MAPVLPGRHDDVPDVGCQLGTVRFLMHSDGDDCCFLNWEVSGWEGVSFPDSAA